MFLYFCQQKSSVSRRSILYPKKIFCITQFFLYPIFLYPKKVFCTPEKSFFYPRKSILHTKKSGTHRCPDEDGAALTFASRRKERRGLARLVVIAAETGGRFSEETQTLLRLLAEAKTRSTRSLCEFAGLPPVLCCCWGIRVFPVGSPRQPGRRW